ncbi:MAG: DMT family transporter [Azospirillum sp.]|nr:DMT family transporter [Azospirillum sp.]MCZ8122950.1 DMT family transporter [Magnetospirillum sp.]
MADRRLALVLFFLVPATFASNMLTARAVAGDIPPVALAFWRWTLTLAILTPFVAGALWRGREELRRDWRGYLFFGFLGMGVCGAPVYLAGATTTATNMGLIYAASPVVIVLFARFGFGEAVGLHRAAGIALALAGALWIVARGDPGAFLRLDFVVGDLIIVVAMLAWSVYSVLLKHRPTGFDPTTRLAAIVAGGVLANLPFFLAETAFVAVPSYGPRDWAIFLFVALVPGIASYLGYSIVIGVLGAGAASLVMYLIPLYNAGLAWLLLGEGLATYHLVGAAMLLPGLYLGTKKPSR